MNDTTKDQLTNHEFQSEDFFHMYMESRIGTLPVKVGILEVIEEEEETGDCKIELEFCIDDTHPNCPDLNQLTTDEASAIVEHLREVIPQQVQKMLEEEAKRIIENHEKENSDNA